MIVFSLFSSLKFQCFAGYLIYNFFGLLRYPYQVILRIYGACCCWLSFLCYCFGSLNLMASMHLPYRLCSIPDVLMANLCSKSPWESEGLCRELFFSFPTQLHPVRRRIIMISEKFNEKSH